MTENSLRKWIEAMPEKYLHIHSVIPDAQELLALEPEELAGVFLQCILAMPPGSNDALKPKDLIEHSDITEYLPFHQGYIKKALMEAWEHLEIEGSIAPIPEDDYGWYYVTRKGQRAAKTNQAKAP
jgi:hypothetical protein